MNVLKASRLFGLAVILVMLLVAILPALPTMAASYEVDMDPDEGVIGDEIELDGTEFGWGENSDRWVSVYFSDEEGDESDFIDDDIENYEIVGGDYTDQLDNGSFNITFEVPAELTDGDDNVDVTAGTYYIYFTLTSEGSQETSTDIRRALEFTVLPSGDAELYPEKGTVGTTVEITGEGFADREDIEIYFHNGSTTVELSIEDGDDETSSSGDFSTVVEIPESSAGDHTLTVVVDEAEFDLEFTVEPDIALSPQSGSAGDTINISGTGFARRSSVAIYFNDSGLVTKETGSTGSFTTTFDVPTGLTNGFYDVDVEDDDGNDANIKFTVTTEPTPTPTPEPTVAPTTEPTPTPSKTTLSIDQKNGNIGVPVVLIGMGFKAETAITLKYDDETVASTTTTDQGVFSNSFIIPASKAGAHTITATDGTNTNQVTFTVESIPPAQPMPLLPELGAKAKSPATFDWEEVSDNSTPVTYTLQISTDEDFTEDSIVFTKEKIADSTYTLTEKEELELGELDTAYYWRIRAVDAAENAGDWTGAAEFYVSTGFGGLPDWALYTAFGIGAVLIFGIGYWLGRRTAFYY